MSMQLDQQFKLSGAIQGTEADGELVLLDLEREQFFGLNEAGARLWRGLDAGRTPLQIIAELSEEYDAPQERLRNDVEELVQQFLTRGWIHVQPASATGG